VWTPCCTLEHRKTKQVPGPEMQVSKRPLSEVQLQQLVALAESDGIYQVRLRSSPEGPYVVAFAPACSLLASNLREEWHLTVDQFDNVIAMDAAPVKTDCSKLDFSKWRGGEHTIDTTAKLVHPWRGIRPEVRQTNKPLPRGTKKAPVQNADGSTASQQQQQQQQYEDEEPKEEQSWLRKYWLYIVIPIIYLLLSSLPQEEGAEAGKGGGRPAAAAAAKGGKKSR